MKFPSFHGSSILMNRSGDWIYSVSAGIDRNLPQPTTVYGHRFIALGSYHFLTEFLPDTARFLAVFTGNAWEYCCHETLTWEYQTNSKLSIIIHRLNIKQLVVHNHSHIYRNQLKEKSSVSTYQPMEYNKVLDNVAQHFPKAYLVH